MHTTIANTIDWQGISGSRYRYFIHPLGVTFVAVPGNYIFSKQTKPNFWTPLYIGETKDLSGRFDNHHKLPLARMHGATHIMYHVSSSLDTERRYEENDLIKLWKPICNG